MKHIARLILKIFGWKLKGGLPADKKAVVISVPHTSIMDFIWGKLTFISQGVPTYILMKKEFFFFPLEEFKKRDVMYLTITPEGSRKKRKKWKKGFLVIAKEAGVPVYLGRIDYKDKYCTWGPRFEPTGDPDADLKYIMSTYKDANPRHPENFSAGD